MWLCVNEMVNLYISFMLSDCETDESCGFITVSAPGSEVLCELHSAAETNFNCTTSGLVNNDTSLKCIAWTIPDSQYENPLSECQRDS